MRYNTPLKCIALLLCAASLLAMVAGGFGMFTMMELGLYNRTVEQLRSQQYEGNAQGLARNVALKYASIHLGGCPEALVEDQSWGWYFGQFDSDSIGYILYDENGNVLTSQNEDVTGTVYNIPVSGNYLHLVAAEPVEQETPQDNIYDHTAGGEVTVIDNLHQEGVEIQRIELTHEDGTTEAVSSSTSLGYLSRTPNGGVFFSSNPGNPFGSGTPFYVKGIGFESDYWGTVYSISGNDAVAIITPNVNSGGVEFTTIEFVTEPVAQNAPTFIYQAIFYGPEGETPIEDLKGTQPIGEARLNESGQLDFRLYLTTNTLEGAGVYSVVLIGENGQVLFGQAQPKLQVALSPDGDGLSFTSDPEVVAVAMPTEPETVVTEDAAPAEAGEDTSVALSVDPTAPDTEVAPGEGADPTEETAPAEEPAAAETTPETTDEVTAEPSSEDVPAEAAAETVPETQPEPAVPEPVPPTTVPETVPETVAATEPVLINGRALSEYGMDSYTYYDQETQQHMRAQVVHVALPAYTVEVFMDPGADRNANTYTLLMLLRQYSALLLPILLAGLAVFIFTSIYLAVSAGRKTGIARVRASGANRIPLDLYFLGGCTAVTVLAWLITVLCDTLLRQNILETIILIPVAAYGISLILVGFCFALVAQCKTGGGYWWRNTLTFRLLLWALSFVKRLAVWCFITLLPALWKGLRKLCVFAFSILKALWLKTLTLFNRFGRWLFGILRRGIALLPLTWQWVLGGGALMFLGLLSWANRNDGWGTLWFLCGIALVLYAAHCFGVLFDATRRMSKGDLETKVDDKLMAGCFREFAGDLNDLADVAVVAAQKQLRSERMKTELITNVSHDIKTPLTSIINYVDLLQKPHIEADGKAYLEVLDRQSQRLKKLIDDLMDMSKASTGNMHVEISTVDAVEAVNQALGEFADKLAAADLIPVFRHTVEEALIRADGKLVWRVLSNLLGNAVKYAMPGTRLYLDLMELDGRVILSLKNISRDELNVDAEELMERFVRGDDSRNTEGSGLGLNIAKSLMELQKGHLQLLVDGDLFKVTLVFPSN